MPDDEEEQEQQEPGPRTPRPFWSGTLSFGLVSIPVDLYPETRRGGISLRVLSDEGVPLARRYYCPEHGEEVDWDHLARGYELDDGSFVIVSDEELESVDPKKSRDIDLRLFVPEQELDPIYFDRPYVLTPGSESTKAYRLLADVMEAEGRAGIATFVMREHEYLVAIVARHGVLRAIVLRFADEVRSPKQLGLGRAAEPKAELVKAFERAIAKHSVGRFPADELEDQQTEALRKLLEKKLKSKQDVLESPEEAATSAQAAHAEIIDLMEVLKRSLREGNDAAKQPAKPAKPPPKRSRKRA